MCRFLPKVVVMKTQFARFAGQHGHVGKSSNAEAESLWVAGGSSVYCSTNQSTCKN